VKLFVFVTPSKTRKYCCNVVFIFHRFLVINVDFNWFYLRLKVYSYSKIFVNNISAKINEYLIKRIFCKRLITFCLNISCLKNVTGLLSKVATSKTTLFSIDGFATARFSIFFFNHDCSVYTIYRYGEGTI